jgi:hypothetical protein
LKIKILSCPSATGFRAVSITVLILLSQAGGAQAASINQVKALLKHQGFTSYMGPSTRLIKLGDIKYPHVIYNIYYSAQDSNGGPGTDVKTMHHVIIIKDGKTYLGSYLINSRPYGVSGHNVVLRYGTEDKYFHTHYSRSYLHIDGKDPVHASFDNDTPADFRK